MAIFGKRVSKTRPTKVYMVINCAKIRKKRLKATWMHTLHLPFGVATTVSMPTAIPRWQVSRPHQHGIVDPDRGRFFANPFKRQLATLRFP